MNAITCECGATYAPKDIYAKRRHEQSARHLEGIVTEPTTPDTFDDLDLDLDPDAMSAQQSDDDARNALRVEKPKRARKAKPPKTFAELDQTDAAKSFTEDERVSITNSVVATKSAHDPSVEPKHVAESYVAAVIDADQNVNEAILIDLHSYVEGIVLILRADGNGETPEPEKPKRVNVAKVKPAPEDLDPKPAKAKGVKIVNFPGHKPCRVCGKDKPLEEYRKKSSRPDGRDTICATCSKDWLIAHRAKIAAAAKPTKANAKAGKAATK